MGSSPRQARRFDEPLVWRVFQRRGTVQILLLLESAGVARFRDINEAFPTIARQVLGNRLAELREIGIVERRVQEGPPLGSNYRLTDVGVQLAQAANVLDEVARSDQIPSLAA